MHVCELTPCPEFLFIAYKSDLFGGKTFHLAPYFVSLLDSHDAIDLVSAWGWYNCMIADDIVQELASSYDEGVQKIEDGTAWGYLNIPVNYSQNYLKRYM